MATSHELRPCLPGEGRYARPRTRVTAQGMTSTIPSQRWVLHVHPMPIHQMAEMEEHCAQRQPAHQRHLDPHSHH